MLLTDRFLNISHFPQVMANDRINMPMSTAGLTRYFEDYKSMFEFKPGYVVVLGVLAMLAIILLNVYRASIIGA